MENTSKRNAIWDMFLNYMNESLGFVGLKASPSLAENEITITGQDIKEPVTKKIELDESALGCSFKATVTLPSGKECALDYQFDKSAGFHHNIKVGDYTLEVIRTGNGIIDRISVSAKSKGGLKEKGISFSNSDEDIYYFRDGNRLRKLYKNWNNNIGETCNIEYANGEEDDNAIGMTQVCYTTKDVRVGKVVYKNGNSTITYPVRTALDATIISENIFACYRCKTFIRDLDADFEKAFPGIGGYFHSAFLSKYDEFHTKKDENPIFVGTFNSTTRPECDMNENGFVMTIGEEKQLF